ncbi:MAG TPA: SUMF1/EgtB/PvdO family nonheme iron enzyme [Pirellulales bacterium]|jgi:formylglycine-generating enzyme required for sulfatase activity|nr:SUMF1/EgtB/PvdO family nonheme iron enzyme [Pirellulales bacterium]
MSKALTASLFAALAACAGPALAVSIDWASVGNPNNPADDTTSRGSVATAYRIDKYEVTNQQYVDFLNAVDPSGANTLGLFNTSMNIPSYIAISLDSLAGAGHKYSVAAGRQNQPVTYVTLYDTFRFANWLNNGQGSSSTETGAYNLSGGTPIPSNFSSIVRSPTAHVFIPNINEWYKAAYYNPQTNSYFEYPTASNTAPNASGPTAAPNSANYDGVVPGTFVDVGSYPLTPSPYGTFDQGGNAWEFNETILTLGSGLYGGYGGGDASWMSTSAYQIPLSASTWDFAIGFRVASLIPEPSSFILAALSVIGLVAWGRRRRR